MNAPRIGFVRPEQRTTRQVTRYVRERDGNRCVECGSRKHLTVHHIQPISAGGFAMDPRNMVTLCETCHAEKHPMGSRQ